MRVIIVTLLCFFVCNFCLGQNIKSLRTQICDIMDEYQAVGVSVVVVKNNCIHYIDAFGYNPNYNDTTIRLPIPKNGVYWIASVSKTFISTAIMQLVEKGKLSLNDDINKYLDFKVTNPHYPDVPITVKMLLWHRSSLNDSQYGWTLKMLDSETNKRYSGCFNDYEPGSKYSYCNLGYNLLGAIIEKITGKRFDEYIDKAINEPLGLKASFNLTKIDSSLLVKALPYDKKKNCFRRDNTIYDYTYVRNKLSDYRLGLSTASLSPAGGMKISSVDLANWMMLHMNYGELKGKRIISKKSELEMWSPQAPDNKYGFAFLRYAVLRNNTELVGMTGGSHGIHSLMMFNPEEKFGFVVICNGCTSKAANGAEMNFRLVRTLYNYFINKK